MADSVTRAGDRHATAAIRDHVAREAATAAHELAELSRFGPYRDQDGADDVE